jgi:3',5'-cyclic AMP phosphodiesterase CpdA
VNGTLFRDWVIQNKTQVRVEAHGESAPPIASPFITWLHLSDIHFRESNADERDVVLNTFLRDIARMMDGDALRPDFIVLTGDLAFSGKPIEYTLARRFLDELLSVTGLTKDRLFVVPGNHDVDRSLISAGAKLIGISLKDRANVNYILGSTADRRLLLDRFKGYGEFINDYFAGHLTFSDENYFYVRMLDLSGRRVALLGLNSSWLAESDEDEARKLVIGDKQTRAALQGAQNAKADLKLALLHHPFTWVREFDQGDSIAMLLDDCDFVLHGHLHHTSMTQLSSPDGTAVVIAGGACYETRKYPNSMNFVRLDLAANTGTIYLWRYSDERGGFWVRDNSLYKNVPDGVYRFNLTEKGNPIST